MADAPGRPGDRLIGDGLELPWHLPADLRRFKAMTLGHPRVMGRRTFEALLHQFGGPLPGRETVVLTSDPAAVERRGLPDVSAFASLPGALGAFSGRERVFIGGGAAVYAAALGLPDASGEAGRPADRLELTLVEGDFSGDTYFPPYEPLLAENGGPYRRTFREAHPAEPAAPNGRGGARPAFRFETFVRDAPAGR